MNYVVNGECDFSKKDQASLIFRSMSPNRFKNLFSCKTEKTSLKKPHEKQIKRSLKITCSQRLSRVANYTSDNFTKDNTNRSTYYSPCIN